LPRRKTREQPLTPLELEIMNVLWDTGPANVQSVQAGIKSGIPSGIKGRELAYTTVQTMLNVLHRKGKVKRQLKERAYIYRPVFSRQKAVTQAVGEMLDRFFGGSADGLVLNLVKTRHLTPERLAQIQKLVERPVEEATGEPHRSLDQHGSEEPHGND
jgi:BlaI family penicillinase repressor